jgi:hypothetical protein
MKPSKTKQYLKTWKIKNFKQAKCKQAKNSMMKLSSQQNLIHYSKK